MAKSTKLDWSPLDALRKMAERKVKYSGQCVAFAFQPKAIETLRAMKRNTGGVVVTPKKNHSHATPLRACEVPQKGNKRRSRSAHEKELAEIAREAFFKAMTLRAPDWSDCPDENKTGWYCAANAVLDEAMFRLEAKFNKK